MIEGSGVELYEFHVADCPFGSICHGDAVAGGYQGVGGGGVDCAYAACGHHCGTGQEGLYAAGGLIEHVGSVAGDIGGAAGDYLAEVMLSDDLHGEVMLEDLDVGVALHLLYQAELNLGAGVVGVVKDAEFRVATLAVQVVGAVGLAVEVYTLSHEEVNPFGGMAHHLGHCLRIREPVAGHHRVVDMFVEVVDFKIRHTRHSTLGQIGVGLFESGLAYKGHT